MSTTKAKFWRMAIGLLVVVALLTACGGGGSGPRVLCTYEEPDGSQYSVVRSGTTCPTISPYWSRWLSDKLVAEQSFP